MLKRGGFVIFVAVLLSIGFVSAFSFGDWFNDFFKTTGKQTENTSNQTTGTTSSSNNLIYSTTSPPVFCTDSDGGLNYYVKGTGTGVYGGAVPWYNATYGQEPNPNTPIQTSNNYSTYIDHCSWNSIQLNEGFCDSNGLLQAYGYQCPNGCSEGVCLASNQTTNQTSSTSNQTTINCVDTDGGLSYNVRGNVTVYYNTGGGTRYDDGCFTYYDSNVSGYVTKLAEYSCEGTNWSRTEIICPSGSICSNSACINQTSSTSNVTCTNTDANVNENPAGVSNLSDGWNPAVRGALTLSFLNGTTLSFTESCSSDGKVVEYYCSSSTPTRYGSALVTCSSGTNCVSGVCVSTNPNLVFGYCKINSSSGLSAQSGTLLTQSECDLYCNQVRASNPSYNPTNLVCSFTPSGSVTATILPYNSSAIPTNTTDVTLRTSTSGSASSSGGGGSGGGGGGGGTAIFRPSSGGFSATDTGNKEVAFTINTQRSRITTPSGIEAKSNIPLSVDEKEGKAYATTSQGIKKEIVIPPGDAETIAKENTKSEEIGTITIKEYGDDVVYEVQTAKDVKILGFIKLKMNIQTNVDVEDGKVLSIKRPWWAFFADG